MEKCETFYGLVFCSKSGFGVFTFWDYFNGFLIEILLCKECKVCISFVQSLGFEYFFGTILMGF